MENKIVELQRKLDSAVSTPLKPLLCYIDFVIPPCKSKGETKDILQLNFDVQRNECFNIILFFLCQNIESKGYLTKALEAENLREKVKSLQESEQQSKEATKRVMTLEEELVELRRRLEESMNETKIAKDELEQEKKDKEEV